MRLLVTGSNRGIGAHLVAEARAQGHEVLGLTRPGRGGELEADVTDHAALHALAVNAGPLDGLVNNAGIIGPARQSTLDMDFEGFRETLEVNTLAPLAVAQAFLPNLRAGHRARIVSISSQMAWMGYRKSDRIAYRASKVALNKLMQGLATDLAPEGIAVAVVDPGWVRTDMGGSEAEDDPRFVARGVLDIVTNLTMEDTGRFLHFTGEERAY
ncbi:SDR family NAD(P)-dependent oxidoreductase [Sinisalibacter aestuarii]|uniref:Short-chain dehydrogenase n=1 Tax=Sinisalibacter aestuarii TaxID=2949426 RepID=A0ABQ5LNE2_9RHOB|nr:SDR family NAD(P)-dependent oxidoreductase [Sinisalibacter aestuarii]GKY86524.1 short-chain dehydrogenase [Sinisalibacter aestuarii]